MNIKSFRNSRNEIASTDGARWWMGDDSDEMSIALNALQPVSALFSDCEDSIVSAQVAAKARSAFISSLRRSAPSVTPANDAERAIMRKAWDDATAFAASHRVLKSGVPVFDCRQMLVGTVDAIVEHADGASYSFVYAPAGWKWGGEMNAVTRILFCGLPICCCDDPYGCFSLCELACALNAVAMSRETDWYVEHSKNVPF